MRKKAFIFLIHYTRKRFPTAFVLLEEESKEVKEALQHIAPRPLLTGVLAGEMREMAQFGLKSYAEALRSEATRARATEKLADGVINKTYRGSTPWSTLSW